MSQRILFSDKEEVALGLSKTELTDISGQEIEIQLLNIVKTKAVKSFVDIGMHHTDEYLEGSK